MYVCAHGVDAFSPPGVVLGRAGWYDSEPRTPRYARRWADKLRRRIRFAEDGRTAKGYRSRSEERPVADRGPRANPLSTAGEHISYGTKRALACTLHRSYKIIIQIPVFRMGVCLRDVVSFANVCAIVSCKVLHVFIYIYIGMRIFGRIR